MRTCYGHMLIAMLIARDTVKVCEHIFCIITTNSLENDQNRESVCLKSHSGDVIMPRQYPSEPQTLADFTSVT